MVRALVFFIVSFTLLHSAIVFNSFSTADACSVFQSSPTRYPTRFSKQHFYLAAELDKKVPPKSLVMERIAAVLEMEGHDPQLEKRYFLIQPSLIHDPRLERKIYGVNVLTDPDFGKSYISVGDLIVRKPGLAGFNRATGPLMAYQFQGAKIDKVTPFNEFAIERLKTGEVILYRDMSRREMGMWRRGDLPALRGHWPDARDQRIGFWGARGTYFALEKPIFHEVQGRHRTRTTVSRAVLLNWARNGHVEFGITERGMEVFIKEGAWRGLARITKDRLELVEVLPQAINPLSED